MRVAKPPPAGEVVTTKRKRKRKKRKRAAESENVEGNKKRKRVAESENVKENNALDYALWTDDDWRRHHKPAGDEHTQWIVETMPKEIKPLENTMISCIRCKKSAVKFYLQQTRSADEPMTRFFECTACGKHWRRSS
jgi:DNA-directed RNA polymerase subunit M/transcription elongation factor TFIIS